MRRRSGGVSVGFSPVVPQGARKWMPASICRRPSRRTAGFVELAASGEGRDERRAGARKWRSHGFTSCIHLQSAVWPFATSNPSTSRIVNQPRRPFTHCAAVSAPRANAVRSRAVCVSVIVSAGPSKPTVWVPGIYPARVDETSIGRVKPARSIAPLSSSAVPEGASFFGVMVRFVEKRAEIVLRGEEPRGLRHNGLEHHDAGREIGRGHDTDALVGDDLAELRLARIPSRSCRRRH